MRDDFSSSMPFRRPPPSRSAGGNELTQQGSAPASKASAPASKGAAPAADAHSDSAFEWDAVSTKELKVRTKSALDSRLLDVLPAGTHVSIISQVSSHSSSPLSSRLCLLLSFSHLSPSHPLTSPVLLSSPRGPPRAGAPRSPTPRMGRRGAAGSRGRARAERQAPPQDPNPRPVASRLASHCSYGCEQRPLLYNLLRGRKKLESCMLSRSNSSARWPCLPIARRWCGRPRPGSPQAASRTACGTGTGDQRPTD